MKIKLWYYATRSILLFTFTSYPFNNVYFYRASYLFPEPRFEKNLLTTFDITFAGGSTKKSRDHNHNTVPLLDLFWDP